MKDFGSLNSKAEELLLLLVLLVVETVNKAKKDFPPMGAVEGGEDCGEGVGLVESGC